MTIDLDSLQLSQGSSDNSTQNGSSDIGKKLNTGGDIDLNQLSSKSQSSDPMVNDPKNTGVSASSQQSTVSSQPQNSTSQQSNQSASVKSASVQPQSVQSTNSEDKTSTQEVTQANKKTVQPTQEKKSSEQVNLNDIGVQSNTPAEPKKIAFGDSMEEEKAREAKEGFQLDKFNLQESGQEGGKQIVLGDSSVGLNISGKKFEFSYLKILTWSVLTIVIFGLGAIGMFAYEKYLRIASQPVMPDQYQSYVEKYENIEEFVNNYIPLGQYLAYKNISFENNTANLQEVLFNNELNFVQKKRIIQNNIKKLTDSILMSHKKIDTAKQGITKYGFLSQELDEVLANQQSITSIQRSLLSLEVIKFSSAIKVFSYLDTFLNNLSDTLGLSQSLIQKKMDELVQRGEKDILVYLNNCYLNPYEINYDCEVIKDFDHYYQFVAPEDRVDTSFFKKLMYFIDLQLEQTDLPSFSIVFKKFDPSKEEITFTLDVNTFQKDEASLVQRGVLNPHIFVVTQLINFLKQSKFILGEDIDVKQLQIQPRVVKIGSTHFTVNNSVMTFTLPIQKTTEREIFDFVDVIKTQKVLSPTNTVLLDQQVEVVEQEKEELLDDQATLDIKDSFSPSEKAVILGTDESDTQTNNIDKSSEMEEDVDSEKEKTNTNTSKTYEAKIDTEVSDTEQAKQIDSVPTYQELEKDLQEKQQDKIKSLSW